MRRGYAWNGTDFGSERPPSHGLLNSSLLFLSLYLASLLPPSYRLMLDTRLPSSHGARRIRQSLPITVVSAIIASFLPLFLSFTSLVSRSRTTPTGTMPPPCGGRMLPFHILLDCPLCTYTSSVHSTSTRSSVYVFKIACHCQLVEEEGTENHHRVHRFRIKMPLFPFYLV